MVRLRPTVLLGGLAGGLLLACSGGGGSGGGVGGGGGLGGGGLALAVEFAQRHAPLQELRLLVINVDYFDDHLAPFTRSAVRAMTDDVASRIDAESGHSTVVTADIFDVVMPQATSYYSGAIDLPVRVRRDGLAAAGFGFEVPDGYDRVAFMTKRVWSMPFRAFQVGHIFFISEVNPQLFVHELMHTYDRPHTNSFNPAVDTPNDSVLAYGDGADYMGSIPIAALANAPKSLHARTRSQLGWLDSAQIVRLDDLEPPFSRSVSLQALELGIGPVALVLPTADGERRYWVQLRGQQMLLQGPVLSVTGTSNVDSIQLLDPTPASDAYSWQAAYLALGVPFVTPEGIMLETTMYVPGTAATVQVTVPAGADLATDRPPVIGVSLPGPAIDIVSGTTIFEISAYDPDAVTETPEHFAGMRSITLEVVGSDSHGDPLVLWTQTLTSPQERFVFDTTMLWDNVYEFVITAEPETGVSGSVATAYFVVNGQPAVSLLQVDLPVQPSWPTSCDACR